MTRLAQALERRWLAESWAAMGVQPGWAGPVDWRWRVVLALRALAGYEVKW